MPQNSLKSENIKCWQECGTRETDLQLMEVQVLNHFGKEFSII